jgi:outer membrane protein TolC
LGLTHEQVFGDINVGYAEFTASVEQRIDLSGWRRQYKDALPHREAALDAEAQSWRLEVSTATRMAFFEVRYRQERRAVLAHWIARLQEGLAGLEARRAQGDASIYDSRRMQRELELARARDAVEASALAKAWAELEAWTSWEQRPELNGDLPPGAAATGEGRSPELQRLQALDRALDSEASAHKAPFLRDWDVGAGYRYSTVGSSVGHGFVVSLSLPLGLWNPRQGQARATAAQAEALRGELSAKTHRLSREQRGARDRLSATQDALAQLGAADTDAELSRMAALAFQNGEASLSDLLDAFESETDLGLARIDIQWEARLASIALDHSLGMGVPQ